MKTATTERFQSSKNNILPIVLVLLGLFVGGFFTYDLYYSSVEKSSQLEEAKAVAQDKQQTLDGLNSLKQKAGSQEAQADAMRYAGQYREDQILDSLFALAGSGVTIGSVSFTEGERLPVGISLATVNVSVQAATLDQFESFIDDLTSENAKRRYLIKSMSFPYDTSSSLPISASLQLGLYYLK